MSKPPASRPTPRHRRTPRPEGSFMQQSHVENLEQRNLFSVTATFAPATHVLSVLGDAQNNSIVITRNSAGTIFVNGGAVHVTGGTPTVANTSLVQVSGLGGNDSISFGEKSGPLPKAAVFGGTGNDTITGGSG